ncbi:MAG: hypothetical protein IJW46_07085 [Clostridia bacterium]|nr:hypothetical protein [Clostridia bacterium]
MNRLAKQVKTKELYARDLKISSMNILAMAALTLVNIVLVITNSDSSFPFSASIPLYLVLIFSEMCGMRPDAFYEEFYGPDWKDAEFFDPGLFWGVVVVAVLLTAIYFVLWYFAKKKKVFSIVLTVFYAIDTVALLIFNTTIYAFSAMVLIELLFHAWVFYYLILALKAWDGMAAAPSEADLAAQYQTPYGMPMMPMPEVADEEATEEEVTVTEEEAVVTEEETTATDTPNDETV